MINYVGCDYIVMLQGLNLHWPKLIQRIKKKFGPEIDKFPVKTMPAISGCRVEGGMKEGDVAITNDEQSNFLSGVCFCGYLVKHSRPDIANAIREHLKQLKGSNYAHYKYLLRFLSL